MATTVGTLDTRILVAVGNGEPTEIGTLTADLTAKRDGAGVELNARRWRRSMGLAFLRMAWATWTMRDQPHRTTDPACTRYSPPRTPWQSRRHDRARGRSCGTCMGTRATS